MAAGAAMGHIVLGAAGIMEAIFRDSDNDIARAKKAQTLASYRCHRFSSDCTSRGAGHDIVPGARSLCGH